MQRLEIFALVSELGNLSNAAIALHAPPSVVSRQISALEREWGGKLFHRTGRGMVLTELGAGLLPRALAILHEYRGLQEQVRSREGIISGEVRIGLSPSLAQAVATALFRDVQLHHPGIKLSFLEGVSAQLDSWRMNDEVDITVLFRAGFSELHNEDSLGDIETFLVGALGDPLTSEPVVPFRDLEGLPLVLASMPNGLRADVEREAVKLGFQLNVVLSTNSLSVQTELAARGGAYTIMAGHAATQRAGAGLQASRIVEPTILRTIALSVASHRPASEATRLIARLTRKHLDIAFKTIGLSPRA